MTFVRHLACTSALFMGLGFVAGSNVGFAQDIRSAANPSEEVMVVAPYLVHKKALIGTHHKIPAYSITVQRNVNYSDLDLGTGSGAAELQKRIDDAAKEACTELDRNYPKAVWVPVSDTGHCVEIAVREGQARAQELIDASR